MAETTENQDVKILLVGNADGVFLDDVAAAELHCRTCPDALDAVEVAANEEFSLIAVVLDAVKDNLESVLETFHEVSGESKIVLLARMHHEPLAMKLVQPDVENKKLADDYLICPVTAGDFDKWLGSGRASKSPESAGLVRDTKLAERIRRLEKLATEDDLTGLKNRRYIWEFGRQIIERAKKQSGRVTLLIFDIDDFKHYNDQYGHLAGDDVLRQAATVMNRCCRKHDVVGRIGGDEFAVIFWDDPKQNKDEGERRASSEHPKDAIFIAERFRKQLGDTNFNLLGPGGKGVLTISGGLASFPRDCSNIRDLFAKADEALLEAKRCGKNQIYLVGTPNNNT